MKVEILVKKCYISQSSFWIIGDIPKNIEPLIDLYNTWVAFFHPEYYNQKTFRYCGHYGKYLMSDTNEVGKILLNYCNEEESITIGMLKLILNIKDGNQHRGGKFYKKCKAVMIKEEDIEYPEFIENSFKRIEQLVKHVSSHDLINKLTNNHNFNITN